MAEQSDRTGPGLLDWLVWDPHTPTSGTIRVRATNAAEAARIWGECHAAEIHHGHIARDLAPHATVLVALPGDPSNYVRYQVHVRQTYAVETAILED